MGRNENVTGVKAILRISVANYKASIWLLIFEYGSLLGNLSHFVGNFLWSREGRNCIKKERKRPDRQHEVKRL